LTAEKGKKASMLRFQTQMLFGIGMNKLQQAEASVIIAESDIEILEAVVEIAKGQKALTRMREVLSECKAELERLDKELPVKIGGSDV
jgi:hypothetical protein